MTNVAAASRDYSKIGNVPIEIILPMLQASGSPMAASAHVTNAAAAPHSALFWAQAWLENKWKLTGLILQPGHNNPLSLRPEVYGETGPYGSGLITASDGGQFLIFESDADCAREWKRRLFDEKATYKDGAYRDATTLNEMLAVYAPAGDVHPVTGLDNADIGYFNSVMTMLQQFAAAEGVDEAPQEDNEMAVTFGNVPLYGYVDRQFRTAGKPEGVGWNNLGKRDILGVVLHRMLGTLMGTDGWFARNDVPSLTDYGVGVQAIDGSRAGHIYQWNNPLGYRSGWASGPVSAPYGDGRLFVNKYGINAVNRRLVSLEMSGHQNTPIDDFSFGEIVHFIAWHADQAKISWEDFPIYHVTGMSFLFYHDEFCFGTGKRCPFAVVKALINKIIAAVKAMLKKYQTNGASVPSPNPEPAPVPTELAKGVSVVSIKHVQGRQAPATDATVVYQIAEGIHGKVKSDEIKTGNGIQWFDFKGPHGTAWVPVGDFEIVKTEPDLPAPQYAEPKPVTALALADPSDVDTVSHMSLVNGVEFVFVNDKVEATQDTKRLQFAYEGAKVIGPDIKAGEQFDVLWLFKADDGTYYYYSEWATRIRADHTKRIGD